MIQGFLIARDEVPKVDVLLTDELTGDLRTMKVGMRGWIECRMWCRLSKTALSRLIEDSWFSWEVRRIRRSLLLYVTRWESGENPIIDLVSCLLNTR